VRNRAAVWGWGVLAIFVVLIAIFAGRPIVAWLVSLRDPASAGVSVEPIVEIEKEKSFGRYLGVLAGVYSKYPFNDRNFIFLNRGSEDEIHPQDPVLGLAGELVGGVSETNRTRSQVETFWSPTWKSAVYIGEKKSKAVVRGGETPVLEFLPKDSEIKIGDMVYNASPDFPLYAPVGKVSKVLGDDQNPWLSAEIEPFLNSDTLREVWILKNFP
jgi:cell shape-determining protein MreC